MKTTIHWQWIDRTEHFDIATVKVSWWTDVSIFNLATHEKMAPLPLANLLKLHRCRRFDSLNQWAFEKG